MAYVEFYEGLTFAPLAASPDDNFLRAINFTTKPYILVANTTSEWTIRLNTPAGDVYFISFLPKTSFAPGVPSLKGPPGGVVDAVGVYNSSGLLIGGFIDLADRDAWVEDFVSDPSQLVSGDDAFIAFTPAGVFFDGGAGDDALLGDAASDHLFGAAGSDALDGWTGADVLNGGADDDFYWVDNAADSVVENSIGGVDTISATLNWTLGSFVENLILLETSDLNGTGNGSANTLVGNPGANKLNGGDGADILDGAGGNDTLDGGAGNDTMEGGDGDDAFIVSSSGDVTTEASATGGVDTVYSSVTRTLGVNIENLILTGSALKGTGNGGANTITGNSASNTLTGGASNDTLIGGAGADLLNGDSGSDTASYANSIGRVRVNLTTGAALEADAQGDALNSIERLTGSDFNDQLIGSSVGNVLMGGKGVDIIDGRGGQDFLYGGANNDIFVFSSGLGAADTIDDFAVGADKIRLENAIFTSMPTGGLSVSAFQIGAAAADADDRIVYDSGTGFLYFDRDGTGAQTAIHFATLDAGLALTAGDFTVI